MRKHIYLGVLLIIVFFISGCTNKNLNKISNRLNTNLDNCKIESEKDTHGGFLGDGDYFAKLDCSSIDENEIKSNWKELPLSEELKEVMELIQCNNNECKNTYERYNIPNIESGYYYFYDRHTDSKDRKNDEELNSRSSYNFSIGIYDVDNKIIYYYDLDT